MKYTRRMFLLFLVSSIILAACGRGKAVDLTASTLPPTASPTIASLQTDTPEITVDNLPTATPVTPPPSPTPTQPTQPTPLPTEEPTPTPGEADIVPTPTAQAEQAVQQDCDEKAAFFADVTIPDDTFFKQDETFTKTWRFRNEGTCTWTPEYKVIFNSGEMMSAPMSIPFPATVPPGGMIDLSIDMVAPSRGGPHQSNWWFEAPDGQRFGTGSANADVFWVKITVRYLDQNDQPAGAGVSQPVSAPAGCTAKRDSSVEQQVLGLVNQIRQSKGLSPLNFNAALSEAAFLHSQDMACNRFVDHSGSNGSSWYDRIHAQGYKESNANENLYVGFPEFGGTAAGAVDWWMNSQIHRDNILKAANVDAGVGYVYDANSEWGGYYTMVFARP